MISTIIYALLLIAIVVDCFVVAALSCRAARRERAKRAAPNVVDLAAVRASRIPVVPVRGQIVDRRV